MLRNHNEPAVLLMVGAGGQHQEGVAVRRVNARIIERVLRDIPIKILKRFLRPIGFFRIRSITSLSKKSDDTEIIDYSTLKEEPLQL